MRSSSDPEVKVLRDKIELKPGMRAGHLTLIEKVKGGWKCKCDCGKDYFCSRPYRLKNEIIGDVRDHVGSCGCKQTTTNFGKNGANRKGSIENQHKTHTAGGAEILYETEYRDNIRSIVVIAKCPICGKPFPTVIRNAAKSCGCLMHKKPKSVEEYLLENHYKSENEERISELLKQNNISFEYDKTFEDLKDKARLPLDFYVNNQYVIEFDGGQHFKQTGFFDFTKTRQHDLIKNRYCFENNIPIIRIPYDVDYNINDLKLETTHFLLTPKNEKIYYESRK